MNLNQLALDVRDVNVLNGWTIYNSADWAESLKLASGIALAHTELAEATEAIRNNDKQNFLEELADTLIRVLDLAVGQTEDFEKIVLEKLQVNRTRGYRHGGKRL